MPVRCPSRKARQSVSLTSDPFELTHIINSMNTVKLVAVFAENRPGQAARITAVLARANINIRCIIVASSGNCGVMKLLVNDPDLACHALKHEGFAATLDRRHRRGNAGQAGRIALGRPMPGRP